MTLLSDLRVVQLGPGLAAAVCGRLFADVGAAVSVIDADHSTPLAVHLNSVKARGGRDALREADLIVCEGGPRALRSRNCDPDDAASGQPGCGAGADFAIRPDRAAGRRSGERPDAVFRERHRAHADRAGR